MRLNDASESEKALSPKRVIINEDIVSDKASSEVSEQYTETIYIEIIVAIKGRSCCTNSCEDIQTTYQERRSRTMEKC